MVSHRGANINETREGAFHLDDTGARLPKTADLPIRRGCKKIPRPKPGDLSVIQIQLWSPAAPSRCVSGFESVGKEQRINGGV